MTHGVFIHRSDSIYNDIPSERYQFPAMYLSRVNACIGSLILYLEPSKVKDTRGYYAYAKVVGVVPDDIAKGMFVANMESYFEFPRPVPFRGNSGINELGLLNESGRISGRAQAAVREISEADFTSIFNQGFEQSEFELPRIDAPEISGFAESQSPFIYEQPRERVNYLSSKIIRDRIFRDIVLKSYDKRCAITGLKLINGGGRAEVDAAHIRSVEANGPDILSNGIALSGTAHWMFDRGLITLSDELEIRISRHVNDIEGVRGLINKSGRAITPVKHYERPHPSFLAWHRENVFKG